MKERELREVCTCGLCKNKIGTASSLFFMRVNIQRYGLNYDALERQQGLAMQLDGNALLANAMGPDEDMADIICEKTITVCDTCSLNNPVLYEILESEQSKNEDK